MKLEKFRDAVGKTASTVNYVGLASLFAMVIIVACDVIMRKITNNVMSITGSNELTPYLMVYVCALGIPVLQYRHGHVWVDLFVNRFPPRLKSFWMFIIMLLETFVIGMLVYGAFRNVSNLLGPPPKLTFVLEIPQWIFAVSMIVASIEHFLLTLCDAIGFARDGVKNVVKQTGA